MTRLDDNFLKWSPTQRAIRLRYLALLKCLAERHPTPAEFAPGAEKLLRRLKRELEINAHMFA